MSYKPQLTFWWDRHTKDGSLPDDVKIPPPFYSTPGQEDRYRRLVALLEECEEEIDGLRKIDPNGRSDQLIGLHAE